MEKPIKNEEIQSIKWDKKLLDNNVALLVPINLKSLKMKDLINEGMPIGSFTFIIKEYEFHKNKIKRNAFSEMMFEIIEIINQDVSSIIYDYLYVAYTCIMSFTSRDAYNSKCLNNFLKNLDMHIDIITPNQKITYSLSIDISLEYCFYLNSKTKCANGYLEINSNHLFCDNNKCVVEGNICGPFVGGFDFHRKYVFLIKKLLLLNNIKSSTEQNKNNIVLTMTHNVLKLLGEENTYMLFLNNREMKNVAIYNYDFFGQMLPYMLEGVSEKNRIDEKKETIEQSNQIDSVNLTDLTSLIDLIKTNELSFEVKTFDDMLTQIIGLPDEQQQKIIPEYFKKYNDHYIFMHKYKTSRTRLFVTNFPRETLKEFLDEYDLCDDMYCSLAKFLKKT